VVARGREGGRKPLFSHSHFSPPRNIFHMPCICPRRRFVCVVVVLLRRSCGVLALAFSFFGGKERRFVIGRGGEGSLSGKGGREAFCGIRRGPLASSSLSFAAVRFSFFLFSFFLFRGERGKGSGREWWLGVFWFWGDADWREGIVFRGWGEMDRDGLRRSLFVRLRGLDGSFFYVPFGLVMRRRGFVCFLFW